MGGRRYQLARTHAGLSLVRCQVIVRTLRDGRVQLVHRVVKLRWQALPARPVRVVPPVVVAKAERAQVERVAGVARARRGRTTLGGEPSGGGRGGKPRSARQVKRGHFLLS